MNKVTLLLLLTLLSAHENARANQSLVSKLYCSILGNQDASSEYQAIAHQALQKLGIKNPESVPVKQMNGVGPAFAQMDLSSFTTFGIWLDEKHLATCTQEEKQFHIYHEASHYACRHHQKTLLGIATVIPLVAAGLKKLASVCPESPSTKYAILTGATVVTLVGSYAYVLPHVVKRLEKEADLLAAQTLIDAGKEQVVNEHIKQIKESSDENNTWWYSNAEQVHYLKEVSCEK